jgi:hypothetical protein
MKKKNKCCKIYNESESQSNENLPEFNIPKDDNNAWIQALHDLNLKHAKPKISFCR